MVWGLGKVQYVGLRERRYSIFATQGMPTQGHKATRHHDALLYKTATTQSQLGPSRTVLVSILKVTFSNIPNHANQFHFGQDRQRDLTRRQFTKRKSPSRHHMQSHMQSHRSRLLPARNQPRRRREAQRLPPWPHMALPKTLRLPSFAVCCQSSFVGARSSPRRKLRQRQTPGLPLPSPRIRDPRALLG